MTDCGLPSLGPGTRAWPEAPTNAQRQPCWRGPRCRQGPRRPPCAGAEGAEHGDPATSAVTPAPAAPTDRPTVTVSTPSPGFLPHILWQGPPPSPRQRRRVPAGRAGAGGPGGCGSPPPQLSENRAPRGKNVWPELISPNDHKDSSSGCRGKGL